MSRLLLLGMVGVIVLLGRRHTGRPDMRFLLLLGSMQVGTNLLLLLKRMGRINAWHGLRLSWCWDWRRFLRLQYSWAVSAV
jgi:hypothetical protein